MHGLINRGIQRFVTDTYGDTTWRATMLRAGFDFSNFEAMWHYDRSVTLTLLQAVCDVLDRPYDELLEDIGTYLVSHKNVEALRRLLRFGGVTFEEFLHSLDDLPDRARLAVADLDLPPLELLENSPEQYSLRCHSPEPGWGSFFLGVLRAMADDYGVLALLSHEGEANGCEIITIRLLDGEYAVGRGFELAARAP
ncbi:MAG: heme NO-binding domain-containing protein [Pseudomonadota bacterium]